MKVKLLIFFEKLLTSKTNKKIGNCATGRIYTRLFKGDSIGNLKLGINIHRSKYILFLIDYTRKENRGLKLFILTFQKFNTMKKSVIKHLVKCNISM